MLNITNFCIFSRSDCINDLGVFLDSNLYLVKHIDHTVSKAMKMLGFIKRFGKEFKDLFVYKTLYNCYVRSNLEFASCAWSPFYEIHKKRIESVQRNFTKFVMCSLYNLKYCDVPGYDVRCCVLDLQTLESRRDVTDCMFIVDVLNDRIKCNDVRELISMNDCSYNIRKPDMFRVPFHRTNYGLNEPITRCLRNANIMNRDVDLLKNRDQVKKSLLTLNSH